MYDFIIVGAGLAGVTFANILKQQGKSFCLIADRSQVASLIADGVYNPVVLKRFTPIWRAQEAMDMAFQFYSKTEEEAQTSFRHPMTVWRRLASTEEQNNWFIAADQPLLSPFLNTTLASSGEIPIAAPYLFGEVLHTGRLDVKAYLTHYLQQWKSEGLFYAQTFDYQALNLYATHVSYKGVEAQNIVFCEGCGISKNPYFKNLPMRPCKGETLTFRADMLKCEHIIKGEGSIVPLEGDFYSMGGTYDPEDLSETITETARLELTDKLNRMMQCPYEIISHQAALRPTVADRRPLVGAHPLHRHLWVLNGLGTRGVLNAPLCAQILYKAVYENTEIPPEMNVIRFQKRLTDKISKLAN